MKILVTGGTGFLGKWLTHRLVEEGLETTVLGRNERVAAHLRNVGAHFISADLTNRRAVIDACEGKDYVIHCGALSSPWGKFSDYYSANVIGTENIITACILANVQRLVHVSTPSIYVDQKDRFDIRETDPLPKNSINDYSKTKRLAENRIDSAFRKGLPVITLRPQGIFGAGDHAIMPRLIRVAKKGYLPVIGNGQNLIDLTYVENVVDALMLCLTSPSSTLGKKYNITNGQSVKLYVFLDEVLSQLKLKYRKKSLSFDNAWTIAFAMEMACKYGFKEKEPLLTRYSVSVLGKSRTLNIDAARLELGYKPRVTVDEGIQRFLIAWKAENNDC